MQLTGIKHNGERTAEYLLSHSLLHAAASCHVQTLLPVHTTLALSCCKICEYVSESLHFRSDQLPQVVAFLKCHHPGIHH